MSQVTADMAHGSPNGVPAAFAATNAARSLTVTYTGGGSLSITRSPNGSLSINIPLARSGGRLATVRLPYRIIEAGRLTDLIEELEHMPVMAQTQVQIYLHLVYTGGQRPGLGRPNIITPLALLLASHLGMRP